MTLPTGRGARLTILMSPVPRSSFGRRSLHRSCSPHTYPTPYHTRGCDGAARHHLYEREAVVRLNERLCDLADRKGGEAGPTDEPCAALQLWKALPPSLMLAQHHIIRVAVTAQHAITCTRVRRSFGSTSEWMSLPTGRGARLALLMSHVPRSSHGRRSLHR